MGCSVVRCNRCLQSTSSMCERGDKDTNHRNAANAVSRRLPSSRQGGLLVNTADCFTVLAVPRHQLPHKRTQAKTLLFNAGAVTSAVFGRKDAGSRRLANDARITGGSQLGRVPRDRDPAEQRTMSSRISRRSGPGIASVTRGPPSSSPANSIGDGREHMHLTVKLPSSKLRQATSSSSSSANDKRKASGSLTGASGSKSSAGAGKRTRGGKKSYVIESSEEEDEEEEEEQEEEDDEEVDEEEDESEKDEIEVDTRARFTKAEDEEEDEDDEDEQMEDLGEEDADADEDEMDIDAQGDEDEDADADADGDVDMDVTPAPRAPAIKITKPSKSMPTPTSKGKSLPAAKPVAKGTAVTKPAANNDNDEEDDDEELSELESEPEDVTLGMGNGEEVAEGEEEEDVDAEGEEEIEVADEDVEGEEDDEGLSDEEGISRADTPDLSKLTARQRAKLGDVSHEYMKLSDEVQAKKHFTAEELSMRRAEMARRRRNLSEKRNEEVKMETINKLLKKQAPKTTRKNAALLAAGEETTPGDTEAQRPDPMFIRWVNTREGSRVAVPDELLTGPAGRVFMGSGEAGGSGRVGLGGVKMVEEVS